MVRGSAVHTAERNLKKRIRTTNCSGKDRTNEITKEKRRCRWVSGGRSLPRCGRAAGGAIKSAEAGEVVRRRENNGRGRVWRWWVWLLWRTLRSRASSRAIRTIGSTRVAIHGWGRPSPKCGPRRRTLICRGATFSIMSHFRSQREL